MGLFGSKKLRKRWVKCPRTWDEKFLENGRWVHVTRHCSREQGHSGGCR